ncbi:MULTISPECIES: dihydrolipoamide acetyltransferase family protein [Cryobacterium]|uniref:Dihydrolipoamide acetyltransferase component of pyruvate dehydrogenase complex n=1 Tax=Cryobacterium glucosi TaxID=1259175 RepID=A0ABY2ISJ8_9MICO|nr:MULTISPECIES: dihydrolipoamide acetyltransferase family protein [Cryobacterium]TFB92235.1 2-oxo acid dehydrogenase subunit E2 [Cryobacterium sp. MDB2-A-1]TFC01813.1 2-oxo acid dehydrogenase subunit E2 [Cryobacterium sp. MDB2-33-2]TFC10348.1 2-oxo acid dehydrogenase subunit E2 [Cryobacterium sp. MDB2-A-2]TFC12407.1 2-oxo acid dehydrogenase subunit E2 [Cryobacterium sp. MDB2-10]TFC23958.1 2-oxo acid dehydrogenase subunit E2 [Cryobacterium glucosi]
MIEITMPRLSDTMTEGAIAVWHKQPGDRVEVGDILVEIETDKATMDYEAYDAGTLSKQLVSEGEQVLIGAPIALLDDGRATLVPEPAVASVGAVPIAAAPAADLAPATDAAAPALPVAEDGARLFASPLVRKLARENHLDLSQVRGTGPGGRIIRADTVGLLAQEQGSVVARASLAAAVPAPAASTSGAIAGADDKRGSEAVALSSMRRIIARRLGESARTIPHFYVTATADAENLVLLRTDLNVQLVAANRPKVSINDLLIRASALALREHPLVNASYIDDASGEMLVHHRINVGVAVAGAVGLVVPVIEDADQKTVSQLGTEAKALVALANTKKLTPAQMSGGTFTISNLGMFGVDQFTAIINPPEGAILAVGGMSLEAVVVGEEILPRHRMTYTLSADHRIIDGALAAQFLQTLTRLIENPWTILA